MSNLVRGSSARLLGVILWIISICSIAVQNSSNAAQGFNGSAFKPGRHLAQYNANGLGQKLLASLLPSASLSITRSQNACSDAASPAFPSLEWNTFLGSGWDTAVGIVYDKSGSLYVAGNSLGTWGNLIRGISLSIDGWVAKLDSSGKLLWNTFLGGNGEDEAINIAVDAFAHVYVLGASDDSWGSPIRAHSGVGDWDLFIAKLSDSGELLWNTFLGPPGRDEGGDIATDAAGNLYIVGTSDKSWGNPVSGFSGGSDAFVAKLNSSGSILWNTFLGGQFNDYGESIAVNDRVYVLGNSGDNWGHPIRDFGRYESAFVARLSSSGALLWNTFLGGGDATHGRAIAADSVGKRLYATGTSFATWGEPIRAHSGFMEFDAFVARLSDQGALIWNTFLGGKGVDLGVDVTVDRANYSYVIGESPITWGSPLNAHNVGGLEDVFIAKLSPSGALAWSTFLGGYSSDLSAAGTWHASGHLYLAGFSYESWGNPIRPFKLFDYRNAFVATVADPISQVPITISPAEGQITSNDPTFLWKAIPSATKYTLVVDWSDWGGWPMEFTSTPVRAGCESGTGTCSAITGSWFAPGYNKWAVKASTDTIEGPLSEYVQFTIAGNVPPGPATLISPSGIVATKKPGYKWNAVSLATSYRLWVNDSAGACKIDRWYSAFEAGCVLGSGICSAEPAIELAPGEAMWWIMTKNNMYGGPWSHAMTFTVPNGLPGKAALISPSGYINTTTPLYQWNAVPSATWYQLWVNDAGTPGKIQEWHTASEVGCPSGTGTCSVTPSTNLASGFALWWIQTWNEAGYGPWSDPMAFTVGTAGPPGKATLISPSGTTNTISPTYQWNAVSSSTWYQLWVNDAGAQGKIQEWYTSSEAGCPSGTGTCSITPSTNLAFGSAYWWIQTWNEAGLGPWSDPLAFNVNTGSPGKPAGSTR